MSCSYYHSVSLDDELIDLTLKECKEKLNITFKKNEEFHISLTRTFILLYPNLLHYYF